MKVTWKDAVTTVSAGGAIALERAYFHNYDWPLVSSMRWVLGGLAVLGFINLILGFAFDKFSNEYWDLLGITIGIGLATITTLGIIFVVSDYVVAMMLSVLAIWLISIVHHLVERGVPQRIVHA